ncbi:hypothetical protein ZWY2020_050167 [Hordeum vulgare]|nr:hypothetical protein ZWY2020_050167 [Hordeum vulgare]
MASGGAPASTSGDGAGTKTVSASLWWDHFVALCDDLDRATTSPSAAVSDALVSPPYPFPQSPHPVLLTLQALAALTNSLAPARAAGGADQGPPRVAPRAVSMFGKPNGASRAVLDAGQVAVGEHRLAVKPDHKEAALRASKSLDLDEVQTCSRTSWCNGGLWISLCSLFRDMLSGSYDVGKFSVSAEAKRSFHHAKAQLLLILIETLDLENLLRMVHDEVSFSGGYSQYSVADILEMDIEVSRLPDFEVESGPLLLAWAVFHCLLLSLPGNNANLEIDHASYAQRAFELAPFNYLFGVLCSSIFRESDGPVSGFRAVLRSFISAFIASYEISYQTEDGSLGVILNIICEVYDGEESLCMQFWDKDSCVDGPIRSVLQMVEKEYPFQITDLLRFLSAVCSGTWPAQCVYNYLERMNGLTTLYATPGSVPDSVNYCDQIEIHHPISIPEENAMIQADHSNSANSQTNGSSTLNSPRKQPHSAFPAVSDNVLFDVEHTRDDLGVKLWNHPDWKPCKEVAEKMLDIMHKANLMKRHADAKLCTLRSFITFLSVYTGTSSSNELTLPDGGISATAMESAIRCACKYLQSTVDSLFPEVGASTSFLVDLAPSSPALRKPVKSLLVLILSLFEFIYGKDDMKDGSGQVPLMSAYLSAPTVNTHQNKKRAVLQQSQTSLSALSLTENILSLLCVLAKYHFPRDTGMVQVDSELREIIIHLLAFISRGSARTGDLPNWNPSFCCPPIAKEEVVLHEDPPLIRSKHGWFRFAASSTHSTAAISAPSSAALSLVIRDKSNGDSGSVKQTRFTEMVAVQIYRIAFLIMKFLCSQAKEAVKRAGELEFVDLAHFPELPMPDILHGLQDQVVSIVTEVLAANGLSTLGGETDRVCRLLLVTLETSLYMELCVSQSCGIRPVLGRFEDFSKGIKAMLHALEKHSSLQPLVRSLAQITTLLYPGLAQTNFLTM